MLWKSSGVSKSCWLLSVEDMSNTQYEIHFICYRLYNIQRCIFIFDRFWVSWWKWYICTLCDIEKRHIIQAVLVNAIQIYGDACDNIIDLVHHVLIITFLTLFDGRIFAIIQVKPDHWRSSRVPQQDKYQKHFADCANLRQIPWYICMAIIRSFWPCTTFVHKVTE